MSKKDAIKSNINLAIALIVLLLSALFSVLAYLFVNFRGLALLELCIVMLVAISLLSGIICASFLYVKNVRKIEKMK